MDKNKEQQEKMPKVTPVVEGFKPNKNLGMTQEYNKENRAKLWDDNKRKREYKEKVFDGKKTWEDPVSGETLHIDSDAAKNKYHMKNGEGENISKAWSKHAAETDHVNAIADVQGKAKHNPFISDKEFKDIVNSDPNYRVSSKAMNASKGDKSDFEIVKDGVKKKNNTQKKGEAFYDDNELSLGAKKQIVTEKVNADLYLHAQFAKTTAKNVGCEFKAGATDALVAQAIPLLSNTITDLFMVTKGEMTIKDAAKDLTTSSLSVAVAGGSKRIADDIINLQLKKNADSLLGKIVSSNQFNQVLTVALLVKDAAIKYINGDINEKEFVEEVGKNGVSMAVTLVGSEFGKEIGKVIGASLGTVAIPIPGVGTLGGAAIGAAVGQVIGAVVSFVSCTIIISSYELFKGYKIKQEKNREYVIALNKYMDKTVCQLTELNQELGLMVEEFFTERNTAISEGFDSILECAAQNDFDGITAGLQRVLSVYNEDVLYESLDEFDDFFFGNEKYKL